MSELQTIEEYIDALKEKIEAWFHKHFGAFAADSETHKVASVAHEDLKSVVASTTATTTSSPQEVPPAS